MGDNCPWCDAPIQTGDRNDPEHTEWTCGSAQRGPAPWQSMECRIAVIEIDAKGREKKLRTAMKTIERLTVKLLRIRDLVRYHANMESGIVAEIDKTLNDGTNGINPDN